jgi:hypothetical protein
MFKLVILGVIAAVVVGMFFAVRVFILNQSPVLKTTEVNNASLSSGANSSDLVDLANKVEILRKQVGNMDSIINKNSQSSSENSGPTSSNASVENRLENLESAVAQLQAKIGQSSSASTGVSSSTNKIPAYIFSLGGSSSTGQLDWTVVTSPTITINPSDYPGFTSFQLEGYLSDYQGNGTSYARLYNSNSGNAIGGSDISTTSENPTWVSSTTFTLPSGKTTYSFQLKTSTGYTATLENARLKVNF